ncbi:MAG: DUF3631 domain-containing protein, partial [Candidatus Andersenbacteria bacterium]
MNKNDIQQTVGLAKKLSTAPIPLSELLSGVGEYIRRYVMLKPEQLDACVLWVAHTHALDASEATPYLEITSPEKQSGKTRLLEVFEQIVARSWFTGRVTPAVLYRKIEKEKPTLLLDESDAAFKGLPEYSESLRGILNNGYRSGGKVSVCVGQGKSIDYKDFSCYCAKAIAGIGRLPDTVSDRSITIEMRRRVAGESVEKFRRKKTEQIATPIRESLEQWAQIAIKKLKEAEPDIPIELSDRSADCWEPLLAIADIAENGWPERARKAALILSGQKVSDAESIGLQLLSDIRNVFKNDEKLFSYELCNKLISEEDSLWKEVPFGVRRGKEINPSTLAFLLKPYGIKPIQIKKDNVGKKGYLLSAFEDIWKRYLPSTFIGGNERNQRNQTTDSISEDSTVSVVSDVSPFQDTETQTYFPNFPLSGKEH